jgi:hypothetical protein
VAAVVPVLVAGVEGLGVDVAGVAAFSVAAALAVAALSVLLVALLVLLVALLVFLAAWGVVDVLAEVVLAFSVVFVCVFLAVWLGRVDTVCAHPVRETDRISTSVIINFFIVLLGLDGKAASMLEGVEEYVGGIGCIACFCQQSYEF